MYNIFEYRIRLKMVIYVCEYIIYESNRRRADARLHNGSVDLRAHTCSALHSRSFTNIKSALIGRRSIAYGEDDSSKSRIYIIICIPAITTIYMCARCTRVQQWYIRNNDISVRGGGLLVRGQFKGLLCVTNNNNNNILCSPFDSSHRVIGPHV